MLEGLTEPPSAAPGYPPALGRTSRWLMGLEQPRPRSCGGQQRPAEGVGASGCSGGGGKESSGVEEEFGAEKKALGREESLGW